MVPLHVISIVLTVGSFGSPDLTCGWRPGELYSAGALTFGPFISAGSTSLAQQTLL